MKPKQERRQLIRQGKNSFLRLTFRMFACNSTPFAPPSTKDNSDTKPLIPFETSPFVSCRQKFPHNPPLFILAINFFPRAITCLFWKLRGLPARPRRIFLSRGVREKRTASELCQSIKLRLLHPFNVFLIFFAGLSWCVVCRQGRTRSTNDDGEDWGNKGTDKKYKKTHKKVKNTEKNFTRAFS